MALRLYLFRHGETEWSRSGQYTGRTDLPLTPHGEEAARALGKSIRQVSFSHVLTSPLRRAQRTCELAVPRPAAKIEADLTEWDNGDEEGLMPADILKSRPGWNLFRDGSPHGESPAQIATRADRLIVHLRGLTGNIALFSHGHFCRVLAARWVGLSVVEAQHLLLNTASLGVLGYEHGRTDEPAIELWNYPAHEALNTVSSQSPADKMTLAQRALERWENEGGEIPNWTADSCRAPGSFSTPKSYSLIG